VAVAHSTFLPGGPLKSCKRPLSSFALAGHVDPERRFPLLESRRYSDIHIAQRAQFRSGRGVERCLNRRVRKTWSNFQSALSGRNKQAYEGWFIVSGIAFFASFLLTLTEINMHQS